MQHTFKDLNPESLGKLINPPRLQISLRDMMRDGLYHKALATKKPAVAVTTGSKPIPGELQFVEGHYQLFCPAGQLRIKNRQLLVVMFTCNGQDYYVQAQTIHVYANRVELGAVAPRFYQRSPVGTPINVWMLPQGVADSFITGDRLIRRYFHDLDEESQTFFVIRDRVRPGESGPEELIDYNNITCGIMLEMSQGGCSIKLNPRPDQNFSNVKVAYIEASLRWGKKIGNLSTFVSLRKIEVQAQQIILRCAFLDPLPQLTPDLGDASREYTISFGGSVEANINGQVHQVKDGSLRVRLPLGMQVINARWEDGTQAQRKIFLGNNSETTITVSKNGEGADQRNKAG